MDDIYLKKDFLGWRTIEPVKITDKMYKVTAIERTEKQKQIIWKNLFSKKGFLVLGFILLLAGLGYLGFKEQIKNYQTVIEQPCKFCEDTKDYQYKEEFNPLNTGNIKLPENPNS